MKAEHYFNTLNESIKNVSHKADLLLFEGVIEKKDWELLLEDVLILHCFHTGYFGTNCRLLEGFLSKNNLKDKLTKQERKTLGAFFTPPYIAEYIVESTIGPLVNKLGDDIEKICDLKICDPAMGGAIFLVSAHNFLMNHLILIEQDKYSIADLATMSSRTLFGVDINPRAVEFSKMILNLNIAKWKIVEKLDVFVKIVD